MNDRLRKFGLFQPVDADAPAGFGDGPGVVRRAVDVVRSDQQLLAVHDLAVHESPWTALHWLWCAEGAGAPSVPEGWTAVEFVEHIGWDHEPRVRDWPDGTPTPGLKQLSFLHPPAGLGHDEFRTRYRAHVVEARRHMPGLWKYVQDVVEPLPADHRELHGISELWFASVDDFRDRYWALPDSHVEEHAEVSQFLSRRTWSLLVDEHILRS